MRWDNIDNLFDLIPALLSRKDPCKKEKDRRTPPRLSFAQRLNIGLQKKKLLQKFSGRVTIVAVALCLNLRHSLGISALEESA